MCCMRGGIVPSGYHLRKIEHPMGVPDIIDFPQYNFIMLASTIHMYTDTAAGSSRRMHTELRTWLTYVMCEEYVMFPYITMHSIRSGLILSMTWLTVFPGVILCSTYFKKNYPNLCTFIQFVCWNVSQQSFRKIEKVFPEKTVNHLPQLFLSSPHTPFFRGMIFKRRWRQRKTIHYRVCM